MIRALVFLVPLTLFGSMWMYLAAGLDLPLLDPWLAQIDQIMGFDWLSFLKAANASPIVASMLVYAYHSTGLQLIVLVILSFTQRSARLYEFKAQLALTSLITAIAFTFVPAAGAYHYFEPGEQLFDNFTKHAGVWHLNALTMLRSRQGMDFVLDRIEGLVTFPSFHTVLAILTAYAVRAMFELSPRRSPLLTRWSSFRPCRRAATI